MNPAFLPSVLPFRAPSHTPLPRCSRNSPRSAPYQTPLRVSPRMHGPASAPVDVSKRRPGEHKGFVEEMRFVAMRLHTKDQAPREGAQEESALPIDQWMPSKPDFMQFLVDSRYVYSYFENDLCPPGNDHPVFARFSQTGLERVDALNKDIAYLNEQGIPTCQVSDAGKGYVEYLKALVNEKPECVLCHWYNYYFAHSAGGRMIGRLMQDRLFGGRMFSFYEWDGDVKKILGKVRLVIDDTAAAWSRSLKDECLKETGLAFGYSGTVLQHLAKASAH